MTALTKKELERLSDVHGARCVSIFMPTHQRGEEVLKHVDQIAFKNKIAQIEKELVGSGMAPKEAQEFMSPAKGLLQNAKFWRHQTSGGLAVFLSKDFLRFYTLPLKFEPFVYHSHEFYLTPLLPTFMGTGHFYLLALSLQNVKLYHGDRESFEEILFEEPLPRGVEAVVGEDYQEQPLGYHTMKSGGHAQATFHGHGDWKEDEKDEILRYFRAIDSLIAPMLGSGNLPLVIAGLDYLYPIYQEANTYPHLHPVPIVGNPTQSTSDDLHQKAWEVLAFHFDEERQRKYDSFTQFHDTERTSTDIHEVVPAAVTGRVDTLFLAKNEDVWGVYDPRDASLRLDNEHSLTNTSLTNLAAVKVFLNGGKVYLQDRQTLPMSYSAVNALYRY
ncbi:MAG: hypothetical protein K9J37_11350 [Saprospiraceae bacterium]|nr:hypothetical protein [Saprospiraceae bacterium]MCF8250501.1 hypothetical protein [Saprospiraceae bacterium]MCF8279641.1 hypothetical protein [Bacteroidales bacterium]MCF8312427.1 hypothetical protein [Saprospiraceae bacterium]MCF8440756.1 hypothetical protein [Saprospiraceae bacterium]